MIAVHIIYYQWKDDSFNTTGRNHSHAVVITLVEELEGKGHHVYMDNYYSSPALYKELTEHGFGACGTVHMNRCGYHHR